MTESAPLRKIAHVDMDAFYASVEQRDDARLRGKPVVVAWKGKRSVVCTASYEARIFGVRSAMPAITAERLCPEAIFVPPDFTRYKAVSLAVRAIFQRHTDIIEPLSLDEAYLDVTENKTGLPTATRVAKMIRQEIREELNLTALLQRLENELLYAILDVGQDIQADVDVGTDPIYIPFRRMLIRYEILCPANTPGILDRYCGLRWKACGFLKKHGVIADYHSDGNDHWDGDIQIFNPSEPELLALVEALEAEVSRRQLQLSFNTSYTGALQQVQQAASGTKAFYRYHQDDQLSCRDKHGLGAA
jgi:impB/mucB/samB family